MSRTFRRLTGPQSIAGWGRGVESFHAWAEHVAEYLGESYETVLVRLNHRFHGDSWTHYNQTRPSSDTVNLYNTRPLRAETRKLIQRTLRQVDLEDTPLFPGPKDFFTTDRW